MEDTVEVTHAPVVPSLKDRFAVTVISAIAGLVVGTLVEKGYYSAKARAQTINTTANEQ